MLVDTINQDFVLPCVEKVAKLCADFKMGVETIFINNENQPETIEIDDEIRQAEYKYTYSDSSNTVLKSEQADMLVTAVERFSQLIPLNLEEIFIWYFEQKGVDNPERFLGVNEGAGVNEGVNEGVGVNKGVNYDVNNPQINPESLKNLLSILAGNVNNTPEENKQLPKLTEQENNIEETVGKDTRLTNVLQELLD